MKNIDTEYDVIVIGGGHAGVEASHAAATLGKKTLLICLNFSMVANMPCNPSIGGSAKGTVVREIDALGGIMGKCADQQNSLLQMKVLNTSKGPGVRCLRAQEDKRAYPRNVQAVLKNTENLTILEDECKSVVAENGRVTGIRISDGTFIGCKALVLATGTHMESAILRGHVVKDGGPDGEKASHGLSGSLKDLGLTVRRLKTGTPPRIDPESIDYSVLEVEEGSDGDNAFSFDTTTFMKKEDMVCCYLTYTNETTHQIIRDHLSDSSMYGGVVTGVGPRYCPSIEDKVVRFKDHERHQLFLEPESREFGSVYLQGFSTSMPEDVQELMVHSLKGLEHARFLKYAYAIEYDALDPLEFSHSLMSRKINGLFISGQIASTSGYEEAAALGLVAGINACRYIDEREPFVMGRDESYIGVMIDDLVTKGTNEPYRLLSSRSEYRLILRSDNAEDRLLEKGYELGLNSEERYRRYLASRGKIEKADSELASTRVSNNKEINVYLNSLGYGDANGSEDLRKILKRSGVSYPKLSEIYGLTKLTSVESLKLETAVKYEGYINLEKKNADRMREYENLVLPEDLDYVHMDGLSLEAREKLDRIRPKTIGEARRIVNVHPSDIDVLSFYVRHFQTRSPKSE